MLRPMQSGSRFLARRTWLCYLCPSSFMLLVMLSAERLAFNMCVHVVSHSSALHDVAGGLILAGCSFSVFSMALRLAYMLQHEWRTHCQHLWSCLVRWEYTGADDPDSVRSANLSIVDSNLLIWSNRVVVSRTVVGNDRMACTARAAAWTGTVSASRIANTINTQTVLQCLV